jgi:hypothetical protein
VTQRSAARCGLQDVCETVDSEHPWLLYYTNWTFVGFGVYAFYGLWCCFKVGPRAGRQLV